MTTEAVLEALVALAAIVYACARQLRWTPVIPSRMWRMPAILAAIGLYTITKSGVSTVTAADVAILTASAVAAVGTGALMGVIARFRPISDQSLRAVLAARRAPDVLPTTESRTGWVGIALWVVLIAIRIGLDLLAHGLGAELAASTGVILVTIALNRGVRILVFSRRHDRHLALAA